MAPTVRTPLLSCYGAAAVAYDEERLPLATLARRYRSTELPAHRSATMAVTPGPHVRGPSARSRRTTPSVHHARAVRTAVYRGESTTLAFPFMAAFLIAAVLIAVSLLLF